MYPFLKKNDKEIFDAISLEEKRQKEGLELIPSENYVSPSVREALSSLFTNKYAEGYPGKRYYGGQEHTDTIERLAQNRAKKLFNASFVNVQPLSGAPANNAVYFALLNPGDTILGMDLSHGGHLSHGHPVTSMTKIFNFVHYKMKDSNTGEIDYEEMRNIAKKEKPKLIIAGFSAYSRSLSYDKFVSIAKEVGAYTMADIAHIAGLIAGGVLENPFDAGFDIMTTTTHKTLRGPRGGMILTREREDIAKKIDKTIFPGLQGGPHMHNIAAKAVAFKEALSPSFSHYARQILKNAKAMENVFHSHNVRMIGGGTSNHLILLDVFSSFSLSGKEAEEILDSAGVTVNKNVIPDDSRHPLDPSGIRLGTPAMTTRGLKEEDSALLAEHIALLLKDPKNSATLLKTKEVVKKLTDTFPLP
jgi:glycine hydroxymethyltransferase